MYNRRIFCSTHLAQHVPKIRPSFIPSDFDHPNRPKPRSSHILPCHASTVFTSNLPRCSPSKSEGDKVLNQFFQWKTYGGNHHCLVVGTPSPLKNHGL